MDQEIIVAGLALVGSLSGTYFANRRATALIAYRLEQLEKKVNQHNSVIERQYELEKKICGARAGLCRCLPPHRGAGERSMSMSEFVTWEALGGYAGAVMMVTLITQFLKGTPLGKWSSQLVAYVIAVVLLIGAEIFGGQPVTVQGVTLCLLNAVIVALAANGCTMLPPKAKKTASYQHEE